MEAIEEGRAFCCAEELASTESHLLGGVVISSQKDEIAWLVVRKDCQGKGIGEKLLRYAIENLSDKKHAFVVTFSSGVKEGMRALKLYEKVGFKKEKEVGHNPAGVPIMRMKMML